jgi:hypothetical protein
MPSLPTVHMASLNLFGVVAQFKVGGMVKEFGCSKEQLPTYLASLTLSESCWDSAPLPL